MVWTTVVNRCGGVLAWTLARLRVDEQGASLVEYALLVALIAVVCIGAVTLLGANAASKFAIVGNSIGS